MDRIEFLAGIDWGSQAHQVCILDKDGGVLGERAFLHSGEGLARMADWILKIRPARDRRPSGSPSRCRTAPWSKP